MSLLEFMIYLFSWTVLLGLTGSQLLFFKKASTELMRAGERSVAQTVAIHLLADDLSKADSVAFDTNTVTLSLDGKTYRWFLKGTRLIRSCKRGKAYSSSVIADNVSSFSCTREKNAARIRVDQLELCLSA
jgi:hypothetical protein